MICEKYYYYMGFLTGGLSFGAFPRAFPRALPRRSFLFGGAFPRS